MALPSILKQLEMYNPFSLSLPLLLPILLFILIQLLKLTRARRNLPPSPPKLPIIGNLHQVLQNLPHRSFKALSERYGPLMYVYFGNTPSLVVSSAELASQVMKTHDIAFSNRPKSIAAHILLYECKDLGNVNYGEYWRQLRKICVLELLSSKRVQSAQHVRVEEVSCLINKIRCSCLNSGGFIGRLHKTATDLGDLLDQVIEEHRVSLTDDDQSDKKDFIHVLLQLQKNGNLAIELTQDTIKAILMDMFVGGTDTTATTLEWVMAELLKNPRIMKRAQEEVRGVVKGKLNIDIKDIDKMDYFKCVIKETLRLHAPVPLLVPRETAESVKLKGYDIPAKTRVFVNGWAIQRDPKVWDRPEEFLPGRFENNPIDYKGQDFQFIPFGAGRRGCPGMSFAIASVEYVIANLLYWFDWKLPFGVVLDMTEASGVTLQRKSPLHVVPTLYSP